MEFSMLLDNAVWLKAKDLLKNEVSEISYTTWIDPLIPSLLNNNDLYLIAPNEFHISYCEPFKPLIMNTLKSITSKEYDIHFVLSEDEASSEISAKDFSGEKLIPDESASDNNNNYNGRFNSHFTFDNFIVGNGNRFAQAACVALAQNPNVNNFNPIFLYGGSGLGKTHLMHAIGNYVTKAFPEKKLLYVQTEQFVNEFIYTIQENNYDVFRNKYRNCDLLLIDDIQFIAGKERMQEEFFHTFNALHQAGSNIVMTCDKPPQSLLTLEERLRTRFSSGLIVDIQPPDFETRVAILRHKAEINRTSISEDIINYIAENITSNIRELEGAYNTVMAYSLLAGNLDLDTAKDALKDIIQPKQIKQVTPEMIIEIVSAYFNISKRDIMSNKRSKNVSDPRQMAMYLIRDVLNLPFAKIGEIFSKDHSTVMHACSKVERQVKENDEGVAEDLKNIRRRITL